MLNTREHKALASSGPLLKKRRFAIPSANPRHYKVKNGFLFRSTLKERDYGNHDNKGDEDIKC